MVGQYDVILYRHSKKLQIYSTKNIYYLKCPKAAHTASGCAAKQSRKPAGPVQVGLGGVVHPTEAQVQGGGQTDGHAHQHDANQ